MFILPLPQITSTLLSHQGLFITISLIVALIIAEIFGSDAEGKRTNLFIILVPIIGVLSLLVVYQAISRFL